MNALRSQFCQQRLRFRFQAAATAGVYVSLGSVNKETCKNQMVHDVSQKNRQRSGLKGILDWTVEKMSYNFTS